jgi:putative copper export protein
MYGTLLLLHILGATVWTGGHIVLSVAVLPKVWRRRTPEPLLAFESMYERVGMTALLLQVVTGVLLAYQALPDVAQWFSLSNPVSHPIMAKLVLLALTLCLAIHARLRVIPRLCPSNLPLMAWHVVAVTLLAILFVVVGVSFRTGWLY